MLLAFLLAYAVPFTLALKSVCDAMINNNITFLTPANSKLPEGTYIAVSSSGISHLSNHLEAYPDTLVKNLVLSDSTLDELANDFGYLDTNAPPPDHAQLEQIEAANEALSLTLFNRTLALQTLVGRIMDRVAPTLESLVLLNYIRGDEWELSNWDDNRTRTVLDHDFPQLTHLTIRDYHWDFKPLPGQQWRFLPPLPSVTNLHIIANAYSFSDTYPSSSALRSLVPNAERIRLSGQPSEEFQPQPWTYIRWPQQLLQTVMDWASTDDSSKIIIQPNYRPRGGVCGNPMIDHDCMLSRLAQNPAIRVRLPYEEDYTQFGASYAASRLFSLQRAIAEFEERVVDGGEGEWAIPSRNETREYRGASLRHCP